MKKFLRTAVRFAVCAFAFVGCADLVGADFNRGSAADDGATANTKNDDDASDDVGEGEAPDAEAKTTTDARAAQRDSAADVQASSDAPLGATDGAAPNANADAGKPDVKSEASVAACTPACAAGQRCVAGKCICDATSCTDGCCDGTSCIENFGGTGYWLHCGPVGGSCPPCAVGQVCTAPYPVPGTSMCVTGGEILSFKNNGSASIIFNCNAECAAVGSEMASGCFYDPNYPPSGNWVYKGSDGSYGVSSGGNLNPGVTGKCCCRG